MFTSLQLESGVGYSTGQMDLQQLWRKVLQLAGLKLWISLPFDLRQVDINSQ